jgi:hypothetical protein
MGRTGVWEHNMIDMTIRELLYYNFADFSKTGISLYNINFARRNSEAAMGRGGRIYFLGYSVAQLGSSVAQ